MKKSQNKLTLRSETVRLLSEHALRNVRGGYWYTNCPTSEMNETCSDPTTETINSCASVAGCVTAVSCAGC